MHRVGGGVSGIQEPPPPPPPPRSGPVAVLHQTSLTRNIAVSTQDFVFTTFEICEVRLSYDGHTTVFLSVYSTHLVDRTI